MTVFCHVNGNKGSGCPKLEELSKSDLDSLVTVHTLLEELQEYHDLASYDDDEEEELDLDEEDLEALDDDELEVLCSDASRGQAAEDRIFNCNKASK